MNQKIVELKERTERYFPHPDFDKKSKRDEIVAEMPEYDAYLAKKAKLIKGLSNIDPELRMLYMEPLLTPGQEKHLFRQLNYYKHRVQKTIRNTRISDDVKLERAEFYFDKYLKVRERIISCNVRLVANEAKRNPEYARTRNFEVLKALISDGTVGLARAIDYFNPQIGNKFSTYCTWVVRRSMWKREKKSIVYSNNVDEMVLDGAEDHREDPIETMQREQYVDSLLEHASEVEKIILREYYIYGKKLAEIATDRGVTKERIRQIKERGLERIREAEAAQKVA